LIPSKWAEIAHLRSANLYETSTKTRKKYHPMLRNPHMVGSHKFPFNFKHYQVLLAAPRSMEVDWQASNEGLALIRFRCVIRRHFGCAQGSQSRASTLQAFLITTHNAIVEVSNPASFHRDYQGVFQLLLLRIIMAFGTSVVVNVKSGCIERAAQI
jgi:hypothetical protein